MKHFNKMTFAITLISLIGFSTSAEAGNRKANIQRANQWNMVVEYLAQFENRFQHSNNSSFNLIQAAYAKTDCIVAGYVGTLQGKTRCTYPDHAKLFASNGKVNCNPDLFGPDIQIHRTKDTHWTLRCANQFVQKTFNDDNLNFDELSDDQKAELGQKLLDLNIQPADFLVQLKGLCQAADDSKKQNDVADCLALTNAFVGMASVDNSGTEDVEPFVPNVPLAKINPELIPAPEPVTCDLLPHNKILPVVEDLFNKAESDKVGFDDSKYKLCKTTKTRFNERWEDLKTQSASGLPCYEYAFKQNVMKHLADELNKKDPPERKSEYPYTILDTRVGKCQIQVKVKDCKRQPFSGKHYIVKKSKSDHECVEMSYYKKPRYTGNGETIITYPNKVKDDVTFARPALSYSMKRYYTELMRGPVPDDHTIDKVYRVEPEFSSITVKEDFVHQMTDSAFEHCSGYIK